MIVVIQANDFAQQQTALYEQFLDSLQAFTLSLDQSNARVTPKVISEAENLFNHRRDTFFQYFFIQYFDFVKQPIDRKLDFWYVPQRIEIEDAISSCLSANHGTFMAAIRFGGAFKGLSGLLKDMHGSMGYVVQKKARSIQWNVRTRDGRTWACKRMVFNASRHYAYRVGTLMELLQAQKCGCKYVYVGREFDENPEKVKLEKLLYSEELADKYFGYGSQNEVYYDVDEQEDNAIQSK